MIFLFLYAAPYWGSLYFNGCGYSIFGALAFVSVPYWGSLYFNFTMIVPLLLITSFRPLLGFFIFQSIWAHRPQSGNCRFPSPIGVLYISIKWKLYGMWIFRRVSVPYWGSLYFNYSSKNHWNLFIVSVPYWGSLYFNSNITDSYCMRCVSVPYWGSLYFNSCLIYKQQFIQSFRPLLGFFIFQF